MSYKKPTKREIKASLDYLKALAEKDFKPKDYEYIWTGDLTDKLTQNGCLGLQLPIQKKSSYSV